MPTAKTLVDAGRIAEAISELNDEVRVRPTDSAIRTFLFELLCLEGDLVRAGKQLDVIATQSADPATKLTAQIYRSLLDAEAKRRDVFDGDALPKFVMPPPPHIERFVVLVKKMRSNPDEVTELLAEAEEATPKVSGTRNDRPFDHLRDADDRVSGVLEVLHGADYIWVPLSQVTSLDVMPPKKMRELMWTQARLQVADQPPAEVFLPTLYVNSHRHADPQVRLGRMTEWEAFRDALVTGAGQRVFLLDGEEVPLLALGTVTLDHASPPEGA